MWDKRCLRKRWKKKLKNAKKGLTIWEVSGILYKLTFDERFPSKIFRRRPMRRHDRENAWQRWVFGGLERIAASEKSRKKVKKVLDKGWEIW